MCAFRMLVGVDEGVGFGRRPFSFLNLSVLVCGSLSCCTRRSHRVCCLRGGPFLESRGRFLLIAGQV